MTPDQFVYWLQGFLELADPKALSESQITIIREHLRTVFHKVTPDIKSVQFCAPSPMSGKIC